MTALDDAIAETQRILQPLFSKPKLSIKLLSKPPFRFIHDILTATLKSTGFPDGYFTEDELVSKNLVDKASKVAFLDRLIRVLNEYDSDAPLDVRSSKVICGLEPLKTNALLVRLGRAATDRDWDRATAIARCLGLQSASATPSMFTDLTALVHQCNSDPERTRQVIAEIITKPKCTHKLLSKPPFRFLHDVILAVNDAKGLGLEEILSMGEMDSSNLKVKGDRMMFLGKIIKHVEGRLHISIEARPKKIVAGLEAERTCHFLQLLALAATTKLVDVPKTGALPAGDTAARNEENGAEVLDTTGSSSNPDDVLAADTRQQPSRLPLDDLPTQIKQCNSDPERTRQVIAAITPKPKCTNKLLAKPPFRFLHDLCMAVNEKTGFGIEMVLNLDELDSSKVKDKHAKLAFLDKIIAHVEGRLNVSVEVRSKKIVAGLEAEKTCHFLQLLALAATMDSRVEDNVTDEAAAVAADVKEVEDMNEVVEPLNLTSESEFLSLAKKDGEDVPSPKEEAVGDANPRPGSIALLDEKEDEEDHDVASVIQMEEPDVGGTVLQVDDGEGQKGIEAIPIPGHKAEAKLSVAEAVAADVVEKNVAPPTSWPLVSRPGPPNDGDDSLQNVEDTFMDSFAFDKAKSNPFGCYFPENVATAANANDAPINKDENFSQGDEGGIRMSLTLGKNKIAPPADVKTLLSTIEQILQATTPLGQYMDSIAIDLDQMAKEEQHWRSENEQYTDALAKCRKRNEESCNPFSEKVVGLEVQIKEKEIEIKAAKERLADDGDAAAATTMVGA